MDHLEALTLLDARRDGRLGPASAQALQAHLDACADCSLLASRWPSAARVAAAPDLRWRVLAALRPAPAPPGWAWPAWTVPLAGAAGLLLLLTAFWRPERSWAEADRGFAATERLSAHASPFLHGGL